MPSVDEQISVEMWKIHELVRLGFSLFEADSAVAEYSTLDVHEVADLIKNGCSHELALKIAA